MISWGFSVIAAISVFSALVGNIIYNVSVLVYFSIYFGVTLFIVGIMMFRIRIMRIIYLSATRVPCLNSCMGGWLIENMKRIQVKEQRMNRN